MRKSEPALTWFCSSKFGLFLRDDLVRPEMTGLHDWSCVPFLVFTMFLSLPYCFLSTLSVPSVLTVSQPESRGAISLALSLPLLLARESSQHATSASTSFSHHQLTQSSLLIVNYIIRCFAIIIFWCNVILKAFTFSPFLFVHRKTGLMKNPRILKERICLSLIVSSISWEQKIMACVHQIFIMYLVHKSHYTVCIR